MELKVVISLIRLSDKSNNLNSLALVNGVISTILLPLISNSSILTIPLIASKLLISLLFIISIPKFLNS